MTPGAVAWLREQVLARRDKAIATAPGGQRWAWRASHEVNEEGTPADWVLSGPTPAAVAYAMGLERGTGPEVAQHIALNDPQDVIARCEAELGILDLHGIWKDDTGIAAEVAADAVRHLAGGYRHAVGWERHWGSGVRA